MAYLSDPIWRKNTPLFTVCLVCGALLPSNKVPQESGGEPNIDAQELHLEWHRDSKTMI